MYIDLLCLLVGGYGFYWGFSRGIIQTVFNVVSYILGLLIAFKFTSMTSEMMSTLLNYNSPFLFFGSFILLMFLCIAGIRLLSRGLENSLDFVNAGILNQIAGGILSGGLLVLVFSSFVWFADKANLITYEQKMKSRTYEYLLPLPEKAKQVGAFFLPVVENFWQETNQMLNGMKEPEPKSKEI
ncbi:MAG: CvpA family protein [Saprospiraceae bacterium]|nr:CvpA family protein [Saprospiraceae bacterium]